MRTIIATVTAILLFQVGCIDNAMKTHERIVGYSENAPISKPDPLEKSPVSRSSDPIANADLGFAFLPAGFTGHWNSIAFNFTSPLPLGHYYIRNSLKRDLAIMSALGVKRFKSIYALKGGFEFKEDQGAELTQSFEAAKQNAPEIVTAIADSGMETMVTFMTNEYYLEGPTGWLNGSTWFGHSYQHGPGIEQMVYDMSVWETGIVEAIENGGVGSAVPYYNVSTESPYLLDIDNWSVENAYHMTYAAINWVPLSPSRRGLDTWPGWWIHSDSNFQEPEKILALAQNIADLDTHIQTTEYHAYVWEESETLQEDLAAGIDEIKRVFDESIPDHPVKVGFGEGGAPLCKFNGDEEAQASSFLSILRAAESRDTFFVNWGLWDGSPDHSCEGPHVRHGIGYSADDPRDIMGRLSDIRSDLPGGDFEEGMNNWNAGSENDGAELLWFDYSQDDAATGKGWVRLKATQPGTSWACSPNFRISGQSAALSAYLRTNMPKYAVNLHYKTSQGWSSESLGKVVRTDAESIKNALLKYSWNGELPPYFQEPYDTWRFFQFQSLAQGHVFELPSGVSEAILCLGMDAPSYVSADSPAYLDFDTISIRGYDPVVPDFSAPMISDLGLGCRRNQCMWIRGLLFSDDCSVNVYTTSGRLVKTLTRGVSCTNNKVQFRIPRRIRSKQSVYDIAVVNNSTGLTSETRRIQIP